MSSFIVLLVWFIQYKAIMLVPFVQRKCPFFVVVESDLHILFVSFDQIQVLFDILLF